MVRVCGTIDDELIGECVGKLLYYNQLYNQEVEGRLSPIHKLLSELGDEPAVRRLVAERCGGALWDDLPYVQLIICSSGGNPEPAIGLADLLMALDVPVKALAVGRVYSAAVPILAACTRGMRYATPSTSFYLHPMRVNFEGEFEESARFSEENERILKRYAAAIAANTRLRPSQVMKMIRSYTWLDARKAVKVGLVDDVVHPAGKASERPDRWVGRGERTSS